MSGGGSSEYYDLPRGPNGEWPKTINEVIKWYDGGKGMSWAQANNFKATYRWDKKPSLEYNLNKIQWFTEDALYDLYLCDPSNPRRTCKEIFGMRPTGHLHELYGPRPKSWLAPFVVSLVLWAFVIGYLAASAQ